MTWFTEFCSEQTRTDAADAIDTQVTRRHGPVQHQRPARERRIPPNLKPATPARSCPGLPTVAAIPAAPPPPHTPITEAEALCYNLRHSVMCYAILDACLAFLNIFLAYVFWWYCLGVLRKRPRRDVRRAG